MRGDFIENASQATKARMIEENSRLLMRDSGDEEQCGQLPPSIGDRLCSQILWLKLNFSPVFLMKLNLFNDYIFFNNVHNLGKERTRGIYLH